MKTSIWSPVVALLVLAVGARAEASRPEDEKPNRCQRIVMDVGAGASGDYVSFRSGSGESNDQAFMVLIKNLDATDALMWDELLVGTSEPSLTNGHGTATSVLTTPSDNEVSEAGYLDPGESVTINDVAGWIGLNVQNVDDVSDDQGTIQAEVLWCK